MACDVCRGGGATVCTAAGRAVPGGGPKCAVTGGATVWRAAAAAPVCSPAASPSGVQCGPQYSVTSLQRSSQPGPAALLRTAVPLSPAPPATTNLSCQCWAGVMYFHESSSLILHKQKL